MTRVDATRAHDDPAVDDPAVVHDLLVRRRDEAHAAWSRQEAVGLAMRANSDVGPGDEADLASIFAQIDEQATVTHALRTHLEDLTIAVERSLNGSYGRCEGCGTRIPAARLEVFPAATHCVSCKQRLERR